MTLSEYAKKLRPLIEKAAAVLTDEEALEGITLYPRWSGEGIEYTVGDRVRYNEVLYKVLQNHTSQPNWTPIDSPSLFTKVLIPQPDVIPEWEQPDSTNAYMMGDKVQFEGHVYESTINNNIWSPSAYPAGWQLIN